MGRSKTSRRFNPDEDNVIEENTMTFVDEEKLKESQEFSTDMTLTQMVDFLSNKESKLSK